MRGSMTEVSPRFKSGKKKVPTKTQQMRQADALFSKIVRSRGSCERCGKTAGLQCAHGFSRRYRAIRWDERNAFAQCGGCHFLLTHRPIEQDDWNRSQWGDALYDELRSLALTAPNPDISEVLERLKKRWAEIERRVA